MKGNGGIIETRTFLDGSTLHRLKDPDHRRWVTTDGNYVFLRPDGRGTRTWKVYKRGEKELAIHEEFLWFSDARRALRNLLNREAAERLAEKTLRELSPFGIKPRTIQL